MKTQVTILALICSVIVLAFFHACSASSYLPPIADADQLVKDCDALLKDPTLNNIPSEKWPASIKALNPVSVNKGAMGICITTFFEAGVGGRGYIVSHIKQQNGMELTIAATPHPNIYRFYFKINQLRIFD